MKKIPNRNSSLPTQQNQIVLPKVEEKSNAKLVAEIFVKNKIIHDLTLKNAWEKAAESQPPDVGKLFLVLQKFKNDLEQAYEASKTVFYYILKLRIHLIFYKWKNNGNLQRMKLVF